MSETIEAKELQLVSIFDDSYRFEIPEYQRPYAWTTEQTGELLDDLLNAMGQVEYVGDAPPYFLGSIVIIKNGRQPQAQIVDGQQRIISLTIFFCVLRELASAESDCSDAHSYIYAPGRESAGISGHYRLTVRARDREFFQHNIQQMGGLSDLLARPHADLSDSQKNMRENAGYLFNAGCWILVMWWQPFILNRQGGTTMFKISVYFLIVVGSIALFGVLATQSPRSCANTAAIANPAPAGLVADCETLLGFREKLAGTAPLNWSVDRPLSDWEGVTVAQDRVTGLSLSGNQLEGAIPAELGQLTNLKWLDLSGNQLEGAIPAELSQLADLEMLALSSNQLGGAIPAELGQLTNLKWLALMDNQLEGAIPAELSQLADLETLALSGNQLEGRIPAELGQLTNLRSLQLVDNQLEGRIPAELGQLTNLKFLVLQRNQLEGRIPAELGQLTNLEILYLNGNPGLCGPIPPPLRRFFYSEELGACEE